MTAKAQAKKASTKGYLQMSALERAEKKDIPQTPRIILMVDDGEPFPCELSLFTPFEQCPFCAA